MKTCPDCNKTKSFEMFHKCSSRKDGHQRLCASCQCDAVKEWRVSNPVKRRYFDYKHSATKRSILFDITLEEFSTFWQKPCTYCGNLISTIGIDRIDSSRGYTLENCVPCCETCNLMKLDSNEEQWYKHMLLILKHQGVV